MGSDIKGIMSLASPTGVAEVLTPCVHDTSIIIYLNFYSLKELKITYFKHRLIQINNIHETKGVTF